MRCVLGCKQTAWCNEHFANQDEENYEQQRKQTGAYVCEMNSNFRNSSSITSYSKVNRKLRKTSTSNKMFEPEELGTVPLTTKDAARLLLDGTLRLRVCRYCLNISSKLSELDEILELGINGGLFEITIKDMVASFYPYKVNNYRDFPNKICGECLNQAINSYLFTQQCERAERALNNCFEDISDKFEKLDPVQPIKKRGKRKLNPNSNILYVENRNVIDYADPVINIINTNSIIVDPTELKTLECQKCWQILPSVQSLVNHEQSHPKSMWYNCKQCGKSFIKRFHLKQHLKKVHLYGQIELIETPTGFKCNECGQLSKDLGDHYQHIENHKFKIVLQHMIKNKMDRLCSLCLEGGTRMTHLTEIINLHGGYPALVGDQSIYDIISTIFPNITFSITGTKICESCLDRAISSYVFSLKVDYVKNRLNTCVTHLLYNLDSLKDTKKTVMIEISKDIVLPTIEFEHKFELEIEEYENWDESELKIEVLEDEFREETEDEYREELEDEFREDLLSKSDTDSEIENPAKNVTKTYTGKLVNGFKNLKKVNNVCSEFLKFKTKTNRCRKNINPMFTCPFCNKYFISDYFIKKHILKHINKKSECDRCLKPFPSQFHLFEHIKMVHIFKKNNYSSCVMCGRGFTSSVKLKSHLKTHKIKECHLCNKHFISQKHYDTHIQRHAAKLRLFRNKDRQTCSFCERDCSNENELSLHVNKVHLQMKPYSCDMCEKHYYTEYNLSSHKELHNLRSKETCSFCKKTLKCRKDLVVHVRKHIGIKPHQCPVCRLTFYSDSQMKGHMKTFHGGRFWCRLCKAVVKSNSILKAHISVVHSAL